MNRRLRRFRRLESSVRGTPSTKVAKARFALSYLRNLRNPRLIYSSATMNAGISAPESGFVDLADSSADSAPAVGDRGYLPADPKDCPMDHPAFRC